MVITIGSPPVRGNAAAVSAAGIKRPPVKRVTAVAIDLRRSLTDFP
jgi:hypothetical protein